MGISFLFLILVITSVAYALANDSVVPGAYIVEFSDDVDSSAFYDELRSDGLVIDHRMDFKYQLFKGASFNIGTSANYDHKSAAAKVLEKAQVKSIWPVRTVKFPNAELVSVGRNTSGTTSSTSGTKKRKEDLNSFSPHVMTQVDRARAAGLTGKGIRIGIVDTGVDYRHPVLGGCFGEGCLVSYGKDLIGDAGDIYNPVPDADPLDTCEGHGTHVSGIVAAQKNDLGFTGVVPDATLGMYRVCNCGGYTTNDLLVAGFNMAYEDGSDIISCSAGDDGGWATDAWGVASSRIAEAGVPIVIALGNSGLLGPWTASTPAAGVDVAGIGSVENTVLPTIVTKGYSSIGNDSISFGWHTALPAALQNLTLPLWAVSNNSSSINDACLPLPDDTPDLTDKIILLRAPSTSECTYAIQGTNIAAKGGVYLMYYPQTQSGFTSQLWVDAAGIKGVSQVSPAQGVEWIEALKAGENITLTLPVELSEYFILNFDNGVVANYSSKSSSWGPTWELEVKPQFTSPGGQILSTYIWGEGDYAVYSGTSMATPFVAGVYALVAQARGTFDFNILRNIISATSKPKNWNDGYTIYETLAPVPQQGAGIVQAFDAAYATVVPSISSFSFNDSDNFLSSHSFNLQNTGAEDVIYVLGHSPAITFYTFIPGEEPMTTSEFPPPIADDNASLSFDGETITITAGGTAEVKFTVIPPTSLNNTLLPVYSGYITLTSPNATSLSIPYQGVAGSMRNTPVIFSAYESVYLTSTDGHFLIPVSANKTFTIPYPTSNLTGSIYPKMVVKKRVGTKFLRMDCVAVGNNTLPVVDEWHGYKSLGQMVGFPWTFSPRIGKTQEIYGELADGTIMPEGTYKMVTSALRIFGDEHRDDDWDVVESVPFILKYLS